MSDMYIEMDNDELTEMQRKFQDSQSLYVFLTTPKVGDTGVNHTAANHTAITQKFWVLNEQWLAFAQVVLIGQNQVPHTWLLNTGPVGYDIHRSDFRQYSGIVQMRVLPSLLTRLHITRMMIYKTLQFHEDHKKQLTGNGDSLQSHELSSWIVRTLHQGTPLSTVNKYNLLG